MTRSDRTYIHTLVGRALLEDGVCLALLHRESRREFLESQCEHLSEAACEFLMSIGDKETIHDFAWEIDSRWGSPGADTVH